MIAKRTSRVPRKIRREMKLTPKLQEALELIVRRGEKGWLCIQFVSDARMRNRVAKLREAGLVEFAAVQLREGSAACDSVRATEAGHAALGQHT